MTGRSAKLVGALSILLACGFVALAGVGGWLYWSQVEIQGEKDARITLAEKAKEQIPKVFGYDYQTVERSLNDIYPYLTPTYRREFQERANKDIIPQARERQLVRSWTSITRTSGSRSVHLRYPIPRI